MLDVKPYSNLLVVVVVLLLDVNALVVDVEDVWSHGKHIKTELTIVGQILSPVRQSDILNCTLCCNKRSIMKTFILSHT